MRTIGDFFQQKKQLQSKSKPNTQLDEQTVFFVFKKIFKELYGLKGEENIEPLKVAGRILYLKPRTSLWANEILLQKQDLIRRTNDTLEQEYIIDIILTQRSSESFKS